MHYNTTIFSYSSHLQALSSKSGIAVAPQFSPTEHSSELKKVALACDFPALRALLQRVNPKPIALRDLPELLLAHRLEPFRGERFVRQRKLSRLISSPF